MGRTDGRFWGLGTTAPPYYTCVYITIVAYTLRSGTCNMNSSSSGLSSIYFTQTDAYDSVVGPSTTQEVSRQPGRPPIAGLRHAQNIMKYIVVLWRRMKVKRSAKELEVLLYTLPTHNLSGGLIVY